MHQPCTTCPFRENPVEPGAIDWLNDVMQGLIRRRLDHSCHLTDKHADMFAGRKKKRECIGFLGMMKRQGGDCISQRAMRKMVTGEIDWEKIPTKGVFASVQDFIRFHAKACGIEIPESLS